MDVTHLIQSKLEKAVFDEVKHPRDPLGRWARKIGGPVSVPRTPTGRFRPSRSVQADQFTPPPRLKTVDEFHAAGRRRQRAIAEGNREAARAATAQREEAMFGTDPSWFGYRGRSSQAMRVPGKPWPYLSDSSFWAAKYHGAGDKPLSAAQVRKLKPKDQKEYLQHVANAVQQTVWGDNSTWKRAEAYRRRLQRAGFKVPPPLSTNPPPAFQD